MHVDRLESRLLLTSLGAFDPTFGSAGIATLDHGAQAMAPGPAGSQYLLSEIDTHFRVIRITADGKYDTTFGGGDGIAEIDPAIWTQKLYRGMHSMADGRVIVIGSSRDRSSKTGNDVVVERLLANGEPDPSFGTHGTGVVRVDFYTAMRGQPVDDFYVGSDAAADGSLAILIGDASFTGNGNVRGLLVLAPNGRRDTRFDGDGLFTSDVHRIVRGDLQAGVNWSAVSFSRDGNSIDLAEDVNVFGDRAFLTSGIHRLPRVETIDDSQFVKGPDVLLGDLSSRDRIPRIHKLVRQADGGLLALISPTSGNIPGSAAVSESIVRVTPDLKIDTRFASNLKLNISDVLPGYEPKTPKHPAGLNLADMAPLPDGRFYLTASTDAKRIGAPSDTVESFGLIKRFLPDGTVDPLFPQIELPDRGGENSNVATLVGTFNESLVAYTVESIYEDADDVFPERISRVQRFNGDASIDLRRDGTLVLAGSSTGEFIRVHDRLDGRWEVLNGTLISSFQSTKIKRVIAHGYGGDDPVHIFVNKPATIWGGDGNDVLFGNASNDLIMGDAGDDWLDGGSGNDAMYGHDGRDTLYGGRGNDRVFGNGGVDVIFGGRDEDTGRKGDGTVGEIEVFI